MVWTICRESRLLHERLAGAVEALQVALAGAGLAVEPDLLAQESDEDEADPEGSRETGQVPRDAVAETLGGQEPHEPHHPDHGGEEQIRGEGIALAAEETSATTPEHPYRERAEERTARPEGERGEPSRGHRRARAE